MALDPTEVYPTTAFIAELRELLVKATPGRWHAHRDRNPGIGADGTKYNIGSFEEDADNDLAVAAVNALPALLDEIEQLRALVGGSR